MSGSSVLADAALALSHAHDIDACCRTVCDHALLMTAGTQVTIDYHDHTTGQHVVMAAPAGASPELLSGITLVLDEAFDTADDGHVLLQVSGAEDDAAHHPDVRVLVQLAALTFRRIRAADELARHEQQQRSLMNAGISLNRERTLDGVLRSIVEHAMELTQARYGALAVLDDAGEQLVEFVTSGIDDATRERIGELPRGHGITGLLIEDPRPLRLRCLQDHPRSVGFPDHHPYMESFLGVPIVTTRAIKGRLYLAEKLGAAEFSAADERLAIALAAQAAIAIDNAALNDQLRNAATELARASRHKTSFLANVSHELRSPLNTIIGYTQLLLEAPDGLNDEQCDDLRLIRESGEHLLALISDLLDVQRIEAGTVELTRTAHSVEEIVESVVSSVQPSVPEAVSLTVDMSGLDDASLWCDRTRIRQVLLNVVGNAIKYTERGSIAITVGGDADSVTVDVRDSGRGIAPADQTRVFDAFYQARRSADGIPMVARDGVGLGLAISRTLTELHDGQLELTSTLGQGTTVTVRLPRR